MPRGGARPGAGAKPKGRHNIVDFPAHATSATTPLSPDAVASLHEPPADLPDAQKAIWRVYAPLAIEQRTLALATAPGFRELVEQMALKDDIATRLARFGADGKTGSDRVKLYTRLSQRVDASLARFKLTAFGKPADGSGQKQAQANPWSQVAGQ